MWRRILLSVSLGLNVILLYSLIWGENGALAYREMKAQYTGLGRRMEDIQEKNLVISKEIKLLKDDAKYQEKMIRTRLNFVRNNEILYIFPPEAHGGPTGALENEAKN